MKNTNVDNINHPQHYEGKVECIDAMQKVIGNSGVIHFCIGNAFKYIWRCMKKHDSPVEDLKKAIWYLDKALELIKKDTEAKIELEDALNDFGTFAVDCGFTRKEQ